MTRSIHSSQDLKNDIYAALELNENCFANLILNDERSSEGETDSISSRGSVHKVSQEQVNIVCSIRARLMQALSKATDFFENNIELLATIATLKREAAIFREEQHQVTEVLNGRISCLMEIVKEQQDSLDRKQETLALKGIWANLLQVGPDGNVRKPAALHKREQQELEGHRREESGAGLGGGEGDEDDCAANVITWLSLQCAQEAQHPHQSPHHHQRHHHKHHHSSRSRSPPESEARARARASPMTGFIDQELGEVCSISSLVQRMRVLFHAVDSRTETTEAANSEMRVKLQEMSAVCAALRRERDEKEGELEHWKDVLSIVQADHEFSSHQAEALTAENETLRTAHDSEKENSAMWRRKCHEILEALEKTSAVTSQLNVSRQSHTSPWSMTGAHHSTASHSSNNNNHNNNNNNNINNNNNNNNNNNSSSTFYSDHQPQNHLFSPPSSTTDLSSWRDASPSQGFSYSYRHSYDESTPFPTPASAPAPAPGRGSLDAYCCDLVERADVVHQSPPTPFVTGSDPARTGGVGEPVGGWEGRSVTTVTDKSNPRNASTSVTLAQSSAPRITSLPPPSSPPSPSSPSSSPLKQKQKQKRILPMDPRKLDDSTLYKMLLEAEKEIEHLSSSDEKSSVDHREEEEEEENKHVLMRKSNATNYFLASVDLREALALGRELTAHDDNDNDDDEEGKLTLVDKTISPPPPLPNKHKHKHKQSDFSSPTSVISHDITNHPPSENKTSPPHLSRVETLSYNTPSKFKSPAPSASRHISKSMHLQSISATKSEVRSPPSSSQPAEWNQYFSRRGARSGQHEGSEREVCLYDQVLRGGGRGGPVTSDCAGGAGAAGGGGGAAGGGAAGAAARGGARGAGARGGARGAGGDENKQYANNLMIPISPIPLVH